jgi:tetrathionate reductase subunit B
MTSDRRDFLRTAGTLLLVTGPAAAFLEAAESGKEMEPAYRMADHYWGMIVDISKCIGCGNCVRADKTENNVPLEPFYFRTWVERYHVEGGWSEHPDVDSPNGGYDGFPEKYPPADGAKSFFVPKLCNQCAHSPCTQVCPVGATFETPDGAVLVDKTYCLGCRYCIQACPYGCRYIHPASETVDKCNLCYHRITKGLTTACCEACPTGARRLVDLKDPKDPVHEFLRTHMVQVLKPHMATGAKVFYNNLDGTVR